MASLTHVSSTESNPSSNLNSSSFNASYDTGPKEMELASHSSLPHINSSSFSCLSNNMLSEFDAHLPFNKFQQDLPIAVWQPSGTSLSVHLLNPEKSMKNPASFGNAVRMISGHVAEANSSVSNLQDMKTISVLMSTPLAGASWEAGLDQDLGYSSSMASVIPVSTLPFPTHLNPNAQEISEDAPIKELVGRLGSNIRGNGVSSLRFPPAPESTVPLGPGMEKMMNLGNSRTCINTASGSSLAVDPSKGGLAIQGVNLGASHCLVNLSSDPGFSERAAMFSCFGGQGYSELVAPFPFTEGGKTYPRSAARPSDKPAVNKRTRVPSFRNNAPNSPSLPAAMELQDRRCILDSFTGKQMAIDSMESQCAEKMPSASPSMHASEGPQKHVMSINDTDDVEISVGQDESPNSHQGACEVGAVGFVDNPGRKRKTACKDKSKDLSFGVATNSAGKDLKSGADLEESKGKRYRGAEVEREREDEQNMVLAEQSNSGNSGESAPNSVKESSKPPELPKQDFIHVRARRGQATDSHSLAERVRREKISERMKFLQDLVPGCSKVTGKAVMLDEIINYVQSLQRQVEFLSMKLAAVNPRLDSNLDFLNKEMIQPRVPPGMLFAPENTNTFPLQPPQIPVHVVASCGVDVHSIENPGDPTLRRTVNGPVASMDAYGESLSQLSQAWGDELQTIVQMGFGHPLMSQSVPGRLPSSHTKVEL